MAVGPGALQAHCEILRGIYDDPTRIKLLYEHIAIEKSMQQIVALSKDPEGPQPDHAMGDEQEAHCDEFQHIVTQYS